MKTKQIPALVMLVAGFLMCIISIFEEMELEHFLKNLCIVLISFYILGCIIKVILDRNFQEMKDENPETSEEEKKEEDKTEDANPEDADKKL